MLQGLSPCISSSKAALLTETWTYGYGDVPWTYPPDEQRGTTLTPCGRTRPWTTCDVLHRCCIAPKIGRLPKEYRIRDGNVRILRAKCGWLPPATQMIETAYALVRIHEKQCPECAIS